MVAEQCMWRVFVSLGNGRLFFASFWFRVVVVVVVVVVVAAATCVCCQSTCTLSCRRLYASERKDGGARPSKRKVGNV